MAIASGSLGGQVILIAVTPILSRLYTPEAFGAFSLIVAISSITGPLGSLALESAIPLPRSINSARRLLRMGFLSATLVSVAVGITASFVDLDATTLSALPGAPLWLAALTMATSTFALLTQAALREREYATVAKRAIYQSAGTALSQAGVGLVAPVPAGLVGGLLFGRLLGYVPLIRASRDLLERPRGGSYRRTLSAYWKFPALFTPASLINNLGTQLPLVVVSSLFGAAAAGELGLAQRFTLIPAALIGASVGQVFVAEVAKNRREGAGSQLRAFLRVSALLACFGLLLTLVLLVIAPYVLPWLLGPDWTLIGAYAQAMALSVGIGLVASPMSAVFLLYQAAIANVLINVLRVVLLGVAAWISIASSLSSIESVWVLYAAQAAVYVATWVWCVVIVARAPVLRSPSTPEAGYEVETGN